MQKFARQHAQQQQQLLGKKSRFKHVIDRAQRFLANQQRAARFETLQYGEITRLQRKAVYLQRDQIMTATDLSAIIQKKLFILWLMSLFTIAGIRIMAKPC